MAGEKTPKTGDTFRQAVCREQPEPDFGQGQVRLSLYKGQKPVFVGLQGFRFMIASTR